MGGAQRGQQFILALGLAVTAAAVSADGADKRSAIKFPYTLNETDLTEIIEVASELDLSVASPIDSLESWKHNAPRAYGAKFVFSPFETTDRTARHFELDCNRPGVETVPWDCSKSEITQVSVALEQTPDVTVIGDEHTNLAEVVTVIDLAYGSARKYSHPSKIVEVEKGYDVGYFTGRCTEFLPFRWSEGAGEFRVPEVHRVREECPRRRSTQ